jgi:hypothetical protein
MKNSLLDVSCKNCNAYFCADSPTPPPRPEPPASSRIHIQHQRSTSSAYRLADEQLLFEPDSPLANGRTRNDSHSSQTSLSRPTVFQQQTSSQPIQSTSSSASFSEPYVLVSNVPGMSTQSAGAHAYPAINYANPPTIPYTPMPNQSGYRPSLLGNYSMTNQLASNNLPNTSINNT